MIEKGREGGRIAVKSSVRTKQVVKTVGGRDVGLGAIGSQKWRRAVARHTERGERVNKVEAKEQYRTLR